MGYVPLYLPATAEIRKHRGNVSISCSFHQTKDFSTSRNQRSETSSYWESRALITYFSATSCKIFLPTEAKKGWLQHFGTPARRGARAHLQGPTPSLSPNICLSSSGALSHFLPTFHHTPSAHFSKEAQSFLHNLEHGSREALLGGRLAHKHGVSQGETPKFCGQCRSSEQANIKRVSDVKADFERATPFHTSRNCAFSIC